MEEKKKETGYPRGAVYGGWREMVGESEERERLGVNLGPNVLGQYFAYKR